MMNARAQFDVHPDAESLNAFAEQALGKREREEIVAHLAVCGRCREVVFLAQDLCGVETEAGEGREEELVLAAAMPAPAAERPARVEARKPWPRNWWMMWIPVGALGVILTVATVMFVRHLDEKSEMAKNALVTTVQTEGRQLPPAAVPGSNRGTEEPAAKKKSQTSSRERQGIAKGEGWSKALGIVAPPPPPKAPDAHQPRLGASGGAMQAPEGFLAESRAQGYAEERKEAAESDSNKEQEREPAKAQVHPPEAMPTPPANATVGLEPADRVMPEPPEATSHAPGESLKVRHGASAVGTFAAYRAQPTKLPSGLPVVSTATADHVVLGVDGAGDVFLSEDAGVHWESVARQWNGRAVAVRTQEVATKKQAGGIRAQAPTFELVNDAGQMWVSSEGKNWKVK